MVEKIIGSKVINVKGETLGKIEDLVVDIDTGKIVYAVLDSGGFLDIGDKLVPIPWSSLAALPSEGIFFLNQSKEQMKEAPAFDKNNLPNMADMNWGAGIFKHYAAPGYEQHGPIGKGYSYLIILVMATRCILVQREKTPTRKYLILKQLKPSQDK